MALQCTYDFFIDQQVISLQVPFVGKLFVLSFHLSPVAKLLCIQIIAYCYVQRLRTVL